MADDDGDDEVAAETVVVVVLVFMLLKLVFSELEPFISGINSMNLWVLRFF